MQVSFARQRTEHFFAGSRRLDTTRLVHWRGRCFLQVPMTREIPGPNLREIRQEVGLDFGVNFLVTLCDSHGYPTFSPGRRDKGGA